MLRAEPNLSNVVIEEQPVETAGLILEPDGEDSGNGDGSTEGETPDDLDKAETYVGVGSVPLQTTQEINLNLVVILAFVLGVVAIIALSMKPSIYHEKEVKSEKPSQA